jgi:general secretion pathway protein J
MRRQACLGRNQFAFTLIEVMVALAIFAVLTLIAYRTLTSVIDTRERLQKMSSTLRDQALFFSRLENDIAAIMPLTIRNGDGQGEQALILLPPSNPNDAIIRFTRAGFAANAGISAAPQRIGYRLKDKNIELLIWDGLDLAPRSEPTAYIALKNIREFRWRALSITNGQNENWLSGWSPSDQAAAVSTRLPAALEVTLVPEEGAPIVRVFSLRQLRGSGDANQPS